MIFPFRSQSGGCPADGRIEAQGHVIRPPSKRFATKVVFFTQQTTNKFNKDQHHCISCKNRGETASSFYTTVSSILDDFWGFTGFAEECQGY